MSGIQYTYTFTNEYTSLIDRIITEVYLYPSSNTSLFKPLKLKALWDTGATSSFISDRIAESLQLETDGYMIVSTVGGIVNSKIHIVNIILPNDINVPDIPVTQAFLDDCDMIIGMDIITLGNFSINNYGGKTTFSFTYPPEKIDE